MVDFHYSPQLQRELYGCQWPQWMLKEVSLSTNISSMIEGKDLQKIIPSVYLCYTTMVTYKDDLANFYCSPHLIITIFKLKRN